MILGSCQFLGTFSGPLLTEIRVLLEEVCESDPVAVRTYEIKEGLIWGTFLPYMGYLYRPRRLGVERHGSLTEELQLLSVKVLLCSLHNALGREDHIKILIEEGLLDYVVSLLWHVPTSCIDVTRNMIKDIGKLTVVKPPSLCSIAKAKLARDVIGLKKVLNMKSMSDLFM